MPSFISTQNIEAFHCIHPDSQHLPYTIYIALSPVCIEGRLLPLVHTTASRTEAC